MDIYEFVSLFIVPLTLIKFIINYLSDTTIIKDEANLGIHILIHHLISTCVFIGSLLAVFFVEDIRYVTLVIILFVVIQVGFLINKDYCWYTRFTNYLTNPEKINKRWVSSFGEFIKQYIRGDDWATGEMKNEQNYTTGITIINVICVCLLIKILKKTKST